MQYSGVNRKIFLISVIIFFTFLITACSKIRKPAETGSTCGAADCHLSSPLVDVVPMINEIPTSGKHMVHMSAGATCEDCHGNYSNNENHKDGIVNDHISNQVTNLNIVLFNNAHAGSIWHKPDNTCNTVSCHGGGAVPIEWYGSLSGCNACHSGGGSNDPVTNGNHSTHIAGEKVDCEVCHNGYKDGSNNHMNGTNDNPGTSPEMVNFDTDIGGANGYTLTNPDYDPNSGTCSAIECHGDTGLSFDWNQPVTGNCKSCHAPGSAIDPANMDSPAANRENHQKHAGNGAGDKDYACTECHNNYNTNITHVNKTVDDPGTSGGIGFDSTNPGGGFTDGTDTCTNIACHGGNSIAWTTTGTLACSACHSPGSFIDPEVSSGEGTAGKHISHSAYNCEVCHEDYNLQPTHVNDTYGKLELLTIIYPDTDGTFGTANPLSSFDDLNGTCSTIACHSNTDAIWYQDDANCMGCHQSPAINPLTLNGSGANGKHDIHVTTKSIECVACHSGYDNNLQHIDNNPAAGFEELGNNELKASGTDEYPAGYTINGYTVSNLDAADKTGGCSNISCHGSVRNALWYSPESGQCTLCHNSDGQAAGGVPFSDPSVSGKHGEHLTGLKSAGGDNEDCGICHNSYDPNTTHIDGTLNNPGNAPGMINYDSGYLGGALSGGGYADASDTCTGIACHGGNTITWGTAGPLQCTDCHSNTAGNPIDPIATGGTGSEGKHLKHSVTNSVPCEGCHNNYKSSASHGNGVYGEADITSSDIASNGSNWGGNPISYDPYNDGTGGCENISCHGYTGSVTWYLSGTTGCLTCHSSPAITPDGSDPNAFAHDIHNNSNKVMDCNNCHYGYKVSPPAGSHMDGTSDVPPVTFGGTFNGEPVTGTWSEPNCSNISCHGGSATAIDWTTNTATGSLSCTDCHSVPATSSHSTHVTGQGYSCEDCHSGYGTNTAAHMDGTTDASAAVTLSGGGNYTPGTQTCDTTACHYSGTPTWDNPGSVSCGDCHSNPPANGAHSRHQAAGLSCSDCHNGNNHANGTVDIAFSSTNPGGSFTGSPAVNNSADTVTCNNLVCHGDSGMDPGARGSDTTPVWNNMSTGACGTCHRVDSTMAQGSHARHVGGGTGYSFSCDRCHDDGAVTSDHHLAGNMPLDQTANIVFDTSSRGVDAAAAFTAGPDTCSGTYCHGDFNGGLNATPVWGSASTGDCGTCHDNAPANSAFGVHDTHTDAASTYNYDCSHCHSGTAAGQEGGPITLTGTANHVNFTVNVEFSAQAQGTDAFAGYTPGTGTCSSIYCHGDFPGGKANSPNWLSGTGGACGDCHDNAPDDTAYGSHNKHTNTGAGNYNYDCGECHSGEAAGREGGAVILTNRANHANFTADVSYSIQARGADANASYNNTDNTCSSVYCHGDFDGGNTTNLPDWDLSGAGSGGVCGECHANAPATASYGSHDRHTNSDLYNCSTCHNGYATGNQSNPAYTSTATHANYTKDVAFDNALADRGINNTASFSSADKTCSDVYCHGDFPGGSNVTADWDARTGGACGDCHSSTNPGTGMHPTHTGGGAGQYDYDCTACHDNYSATHINGTLGEINFSPGYRGSDGSASFNSTEKTCASLYCHGDFPGGKNATPDWDIDTTGDCGTCHDNAPLNTAYGSHKRHTGSGDWNYSCSVCHNGYATGNEGSAAYVSTATHADGTKNIAFDNAIADRGINNTASFASADKTCSDVYCHGDFTGGLNATADWDGGTGGACGDCHSDTNPGTGSHTMHTGGGAGEYDMACTTCHFNYTATHINGTPGEINFENSVNVRGTDLTAGFNNTDNTCSGTYCHGDFPGGKNATPDWDIAATGDCGTCHDNAPANATSGSHDLHTNAGNYNYDCSTCHNGYATGNEGTAAYISVSTHADGTKNIVFDNTVADRGFGVTASYTSADKTCANVYCHGDFTGGLNATADWDAVTGGACGNCHSVSNPGTGLHDIHTGGGAGQYNYACTSCHNDSTVHVNGTLGDISFNASARGSDDTATFNDADNTCSSVYCHGDFPGGNTSNIADWDLTGAGSGGNCGECHSNAPLKAVYGSHDLHTDSDRIGCSTCHNGYATGNETAPAYVSTGTHADFTKNVAFDNAVADRGMGGAVSYNSTDKTCANTYCHGDFTGGSNATADWDGVTGGACGDCHVTADYTTGMHPTHTGNGAGEYGFSCNLCHDITSNHIDGKMGDIRFAESALVRGADNSAVFNDTENTCSGTYCHGDFNGGSNATPDWDNAASGDCGTCHDNAPSKVNYGSHDLHTDAGNYNFSCSTCHNGYATGNESTAALVSTAAHVNGSKDVAFDNAVADRGMGTAISYDSTAKTCANTYCHGDFTGGSNATADWDGVTGGACGDCHSSTNPGTGMHPVHVGGGTGQYNYSCATCHNGTGLHVNGILGDIDFDPNARGADATASFNDTDKTCTSVYCHGDFAGGKNAVPDWDLASTGSCGTCHDNAPLKASYGSHDRHTDSDKYGCSTCHNGYASGNETGAAYTSTATHANFTKDIAFDDTVADRGMGAGIAYDSVNKTCANTYCHGDFTGGSNATADWDGVTGGTCGDCHSTSNPGTGLHDIHTGGGAGQYDYSCTSCHNDPTRHADGTLGDISFDPTVRGADGTATFDSTGNTCASVYCHGDFPGGKNATADWDLTGAGSGGACGECHDNAPLNTAYGSHDKHTDQGNWNYSCSVCHNSYATGNEGAASYVSTATHANGTKNIAFDNTIADRGINTAASFTSADKTCADVYCHGDFTGGLNATADWDGGTGGACGNCHSDTNPGTGSHTVHTGGGSGEYNYSCTTCHFNYTATHINGTSGEISFDANAQGSDGSAIFNSTDHTCSSVYCHGDFEGGNTTNVADWDLAGAGSGGACGECHNNAPQTALYGSHDKHTDAGEKNYDCSVCHNGYATGNEATAAYVSTATHADFTKNVAYDNTIADRGMNNPASFTSADKTCGDVYCHGDFTGGLNVTADWDARTGGACGNCHSTSNPGTGLHNIHTGGGAGQYDYACTTCHNDSTLHTNGILGDISFDANARGGDGTATFNSTDNTCAGVYCHGDFTGGNSSNVADWDLTGAGSGGNCGECHDNAPANAVYGVHDIHTNSGAGSYNYDCSHCHNGYASGNEGSAVYASTSTHADFTINVAFSSSARGADATAVYNDTNNTCSSVYCHGDFDGGLGATPDWDIASTGDCGTCHANAPVKADYGSHDLHTDSDRYSCSVCHSGYATGNETAAAFVSTSTHANFTKNVAFDNSVADRGMGTAIVYNSTNKTCQYTYCHGDFTGNADIVPVTGNIADWDGVTGGACLDCHSTGTPTTGSHTRHISAPYTYDCTKCHTSFGHIDGTFGGPGGVGFDAVNPNGSYSSGTCNNLYCHGNTTGGGDWNDFDNGAVSANNHNPVWGSGALTCNSCHDGSGGTLISGMHDTHIGNDAGSVKYGFTCHKCHEGTVSEGGVVTSLHADAVLHVDMDNDTNPSASAYDFVNNQCANTYCHGNFTGGLTATADWDSAASGDCGTCHDLAPSTNAHNLHTLTAYYNYQCSNCHDGITTDASREGGTFGIDTTSGIVSHVNFSNTVVFGNNPSAGIIGDQGDGDASYSSGNCSNTYCHGDFRGSSANLPDQVWSEGNVSNTPNWTAGTGGACGDCHGETSGNNAGLGIPNTSTAWETDGESHVKHAGVNGAGGYNYPCGFCHEGVYDAVLSIGNGLGGAYESGVKTPDYTVHADGKRTALNFYAGFTSSEGNKQYNGLQDVTCSNIYCHSNGWGRSSTAVDAGGISSPRWGGAGKSDIDCMSCHNGGSRPQPHNNASGRDHYNKSEHSDYSCNHCHESSMNSTGENYANTTVDYTSNRHVNTWVNVQFGADTGSVGGGLYYNNTSGSCYVQCHKGHNPRSSWYNATFAPDSWLREENTGGDDRTH